MRSSLAECGAGGARGRGQAARAPPRPRSVIVRAKLGANATLGLSLRRCRERPLANGPRQLWSIGAVYTSAVFLAVQDKVYRYKVQLVCV